MRAEGVCLASRTKTAAGRGAAKFEYWPDSGPHLPFAKRMAVLSPSGEKKAASGLIRKQIISRRSKPLFPVLPSVEDSKDRHCPLFNGKRDRHPALKTSNPKTGPDIVAAVAAFGSHIEFQAELFNAFNISKCYNRSCNIRYPTIKRQQVFPRLGREDDPSMDHASSFSRCACSARISAKTCSAGMPRSGLAFIAS